MGTLLCLLDQSLHRSNFGCMDFSCSISASSRAEASEAETELNKKFLLCFILQLLYYCCSLSTKDGFKMLLHHSKWKCSCTISFYEIIKDIFPFQWPFLIISFSYGWEMGNVTILLKELKYLQSREVERNTPTGYKRSLAVQKLNKLWHLCSMSFN